MSTGNARALAEEDGNASHSNTLSVSSSSVGGVSPRRASFAPGNTTKVLADLQAGVLNAKNALENTKAQLRVSQRQVSQLTRQTEDLKEVRERLRLENEGLNNVVVRKERLLQEVRHPSALGCVSASEPSLPYVLFSVLARSSLFVPRLRSWNGHGKRRQRRCRYEGS